jgi:predicted aldo/keto reductase-like oxidoreductase
MEKIRLGRTGFFVSAIGFGGIPITRLPLGEGAKLIRDCFDKGITFFDTAPLYGDSEVKVGAGLKGVRDQVIVATKTFKRRKPEAAKDLEDSLSRLKMDGIDLYQLHNVADMETLETVLGSGGAYEAAARAREAGKVRHIGLTSHNIDVAAKACRTGLFSTIQIPFSMIEYDPAERLFPVAEAQDMGIIAMKPLGGGLLERADLCFKFLQQYRNVVPIPGVESSAEVDENISYYRSARPLTDEDWADIERIRGEVGTRFCHRCGYCQPCAQGVEVWKVLLFEAQVKRFPAPMAIAMAKEVMKQAENCIQCGECAEKCPYELPVPELISESLDHYRQFCREHGVSA